MEQDEGRGRHALRFLALALEDSPWAFCGGGDQVSLILRRHELSLSRFVFLVLCCSVATQLLALSLCLSFCIFRFVYQFVFDKMGQQLTTPLTLTLDHWKIELIINLWKSETLADVLFLGMAHF